MPWWSGDEISGQTILVWGEQGLGDQILHAGMIPDLITKAGHVVLECEPRLHSLFTRSFPSATVVPTSLPPRPAIAAANPVLQTASGSLGQWFRSDQNTFSLCSIYLSADLNHVDKHRVNLKNRFGDRPRIGVAWKSARVGLGRYKSSDLQADWSPILQVSDDAAFVSLQYGMCLPISTRQKRVMASQYTKIWESMSPMTLMVLPP